MKSETLGLERERGAVGMGGELRLRDGVRVEFVGDEAVVLDGAGESVHRVTGDAVRALELLSQGVAAADVPETLLPTIDELTALGVVDAPATWTRRRAILAGGSAVFAAATVTTFALADPAAAVTKCSGSAPTSTPVKYTTAGTHTFKTGPGVTSLLVRAWGGGGSGGHDAATLGGGGGGGGAYASSTISVLECTNYTVVVGAGGTGNSQDGSASTFKDGATLKAAGGSRGINAAAYDSGDGGAGGTVANSVGTVRYRGGNGGTGGAAGDTACGGGSAGSGGNGGDGSAGSAGGGGAGTPGGAAGGSENNAGSAPGGGGGGGDNTGGNGAAGAVWVGV